MKGQEEAPMAIFRHRALACHPPFAGIHAEFQLVKVVP